MKQILLTLFLMAFFPISMMAYDCEVGGIYYNLNSGKKTAEVTYARTYSDSYSGSVVIPLSFVYNGNTYSVTSIGSSAFESCRSLTSIDIPNSVTSIGSYAFELCSALISIDIPSSVTSIGSYAFEKCSSLTTITFPNSVTSIGDYIFLGCSNLPIEDNLRYADTYLVEAVDKTLSSYTIRLGTRHIGSHAFQECSSLTSIDIPSSVTSIGWGAFDECSGLTSIAIPSSVTSIGDGAFLGCSGLTSITIPSSLTSIGFEAFSFCSSLTSITVEEGNPVYDSRNNCNALIKTSSNTLIQGCNNTTIPEGVMSIMSYAFLGCSGLTSITIPSSVMSIGGSAFSGCSGLTSISVEWEEPLAVTSGVFDGFSRDQATLYVPTGTKEAYEAAAVWKDFGNIVEKAPNPIITFADAKVKALCVENWDTDHDGELSTTEAAAVTDLGQVFKDNKEITSFDELQFFTGLTYLGCDDGVSQPFFGCSSLTSITIPNSVTRIETWTFFGCSSLTGITIPNSVTSIESWAFQGCSGLTSIEIPHSVTSIGGGAFPDCTGLSAIKVDSGNTVYDSRDNCNAIIETATNTLNNGCKNTVIPSSVTARGDAAFQGITNLASIEIPDNVVSIGRQAFEHCSDLTSINIPNSVTSLGMLAFGYCYGLTSVTIPNSVELIDGNAFSECI